jgi:hypothetical protein
MSVANAEQSVMRFLNSKRETYTQLLDRNSTAAMTHTFLDGRFPGKFFIPEAYAEEFLECVARDIERGTLPPLNELRSDVFRLYVDLDMVVPADTAIDVEHVAKAITSQMARFVPDGSRVRCIALTTPPVDKGGGRTKHGAHLHFPDLLVAPEQALRMREAAIAALQRDDAPGMAAVDWAEAYDNAPYSNPCGGLRMVGAPKADKCPECRNAKQAAKACRNVDCVRGRVVVDRRYTFAFCLRRDGTRDNELGRLLRRNAGCLVRLASIRATAEEMRAPRLEWAPFPGCPNFNPLQQRHKQPALSGKRTREFPEEKKSMQDKWSRRQYDANEKQRGALTNIFRARFPDPVAGDVYGRVCISKVNYAKREAGEKTGRKLYAQFTGEGESWCLNIGRDHRSNRVYGVVTSDGLAWLQCHCSCPTSEGRKKGPCSRFTSAVKKLSPAELAVLFPDDADKKAPSAGGKTFL